MEAARIRLYYWCWEYIIDQPTWGTLATLPSSFTISLSRSSRKSIVIIDPASSTSTFRSGRSAVMTATASCCVFPTSSGHWVLFIWFILIDRLWSNWMLNFKPATYVGKTCFAEGGSQKRAGKVSCHAMQCQVVINKYPWKIAKTLD